MAEKKNAGAAQNALSAAYETQQTIARSAVAAQDRNVQFAQQVFEQSVNVLKSHVEATRDLTKKLEAQAQEPQDALKSTWEAALAAQKRNTQLAQYVLDSSVDTLKSHVEATRELTQELARQAQQQQEIWQELPFVKMYRDLFFAPFAAYKQALEATQAIGEQAIHSARRTAQQGLEFGQQVSDRVMENAQTVLKGKR
jgi:hypothetical protein